MYMGIGALFCVSFSSADQIRHRRKNVCAVDAVSFRTKHDVVACGAPRGLLLHLDVGHSVFCKDALFFCDKQRRCIRECDETEQGFCHFGAGSLGDVSAEGKLRIDRAEERSGSCASLEK